MTAQTELRVQVGGARMEDSLTVQFDELVRCMHLLADPAEHKFLEYIEGEGQLHQKVQHLESEVRRLQDQCVQYQKQIKASDMKLKNARLLLDVEKAKRIKAEQDRNDLTGQIELVMELLGRGQVNETREKLQQLQHSFTGVVLDPRRSLRDHSPGPLSTIAEDNDTADTILDVSQIDITEDDDLEESHLRSGRTYKRKSSPEIQNKSGNKRRSSRNDENQKPESEVKMYHTAAEELRKPLSQLQPSAPPLIEEQQWLSPNKHSSLGLVSQVPITPTHNMLSPSTPFTPQNQHHHSNQPYSTPTHTPQLRSFPSASKMNSRAHTFYTKNIYKTEHCQPCGKRIKFGKVALRCRDCRATCHPECRESVPLPCIPLSNTPTAKGQPATIADFTPLQSPMVPAIVVHCCNEVEHRGLSEVGIYRVSGPEKDVRELKEQFVRGKGLPNLSQVDVHVVAGCLKLFLRSLKESLVTHLMWKVFITAVERTDSQDHAELYQAISELPQPNRDTLAYIITHLQRVAEWPECKMPISNLAKVFGPTLVGYSVPEPDPATILQETKQQQVVMERLLEIPTHYLTAFLEVQERSQVPSTPESGGNLLGGLPTARRRSLVSRISLRDTPRTPFRK